MKKLQRNFIETCMHYHRLMLLVVGMLVLLGAVAISQIPKQEYPVFTIRQGVIVAVYPGATAEEVEEQVAKPLEEFIFTYKEIRREKTYTCSQDGSLMMRVELNEDITDKDEVWSKIKHGIEGFKAQLPPGVLAVVVNDDFGDTSALLITLESDDKTYRELEDYLTKLEGELRRVKKISNLRRYGLQKEQISVYLDRQKLAAYGINLPTLMTQLNLESTTTGGAYANNESLDIPIHVSVSYSNEYQIAEQIIAVGPDGNNIRLKDVARVVREYDKPDSYVTNNGHKAIVLSLEMREGENIVAFGKEVDEVLADFQKTLPESVKMERIADQPKVVDNSVTSFLRDLVVSILIVIAVMLILFSFRSAVVAAMSIPISIFITIGLMYLFGLELNTVTLAILIVVLGMIVDNSVIVIDAYVENLDKGMSRWYAAMRSAKDYLGSILLATVCISSIFFPFLKTMTGQYYDFVKYVPPTFAISLLTSLLIAMLFIPFVEYKLIKKGNKQRIEEKKAKGKKGFSMLTAVQSGYEAVLRMTFRFPWLTICLGVASIGLGAYILMSLPQRMMPRADRDQFAVEIYLPQGTALERTEEVADSVYNVLKADERVKSITQFVGTSSPRFQMTYAPNPASKHYAQFIVNTISNEATVELLDEYTDTLADRWSNAYVRLKQLDYNVAEAPIEIRLRDHDIDALRAYADTLMEFMRGCDDFVWIHTNFEERLPSIEVALDPVKSTQLGVSRTTAAAELSMRYNGFNAGTLWEGDYPLSIVLKTHDDWQSDPFDQVGDEYVSTVTGQDVPLRQVSDVKPGWHPGQIVRRTGVHTMTVMANVKRDCNETTSLMKIGKFLKEKGLPEGMTYEYGGCYEKDHEIDEPIMGGLLMAVLIIFFFLLFNFRKVSLALVSVGSIMLCILGAALGLLILGQDFGLTSVLGITALLGINVRNAIIMYEHAENLRVNEKWSAKDAAFDAGRRRMTPIFMTSATTAVGVVPMILGKSSLWMPMGTVICFGTIVSMILIVTVLPVTYWKLQGGNDK